jgi:hypothetical protein
VHIVERKTFLGLPSGTLYSKYEPCVFGPLEIKCDSLENDYICQSIADAIDCTGSDDYGEKLQAAEEYGSSLRMNFDCAGRDGCFDEGQLFAVWEEADVTALLERIKQV